MNDDTDTAEDKFSDEEFIKDIDKDYADYMENLHESDEFPDEEEDDEEVMFETKVVKDVEDD